MVKGLTNSLASSKSRAKAQFPPNITVHSFDPTTRDYFNFSIGDIWINRGTNIAPLQRIWMLVAQRANIATWVLFINGGGGPVVGLHPDVGAVVNPLLGIILIHNADGNVITSNGSPPANRLNIDLANTITIQNAIFTINGGIVAGNTMNNANPAQFSGVKSRNGGVVLNGDILTKFEGLGNDGTNPAVGGGLMQFVVTGAPGLNAIPTTIQFWNTPVGGPLTQRMDISDAGNVQIFTPDSGIGLSILGGGLTVVGNMTNITAFGRVLNGTGIPLLVDNAGDFGTVASSIRYKQNIKDMADDSSIIMNLRPVTFNYKKQPDLSAWGLIAEEVEQIFPQLVAYNKNQEAESVKYQDLIPLLLNEVQKLNKRVKDLEDKACQTN